MNLSVQIFRFTLAAACVLCLQACSITATMIPVEGPLSQTKPIPLIRVRVDGVQSNSGDISFMMPGQDKCEGRWASAAGAGITLFSESLISQYGTAYLTGYSQSTGHVRNPGQALATCAKGRSFQLEFVTGAGTAHGFGIGKDSEANVYKFVF